MVDWSQCFEEYSSTNPRHTKGLINVSCLVAHCQTLSFVLTIRWTPLTAKTSVVYLSF